MNIPDDDFLAAIESASKAHFQLCNLWSNAHRPKADPEAWREEYRKKQAAGVRFENRAGIFWQSGTWNFGGNKEDYREVPQEPEVNVEIRRWADRYYSLWCFVENSLPKGASSDAFDIFRSYAYQVNEEIYGIQDAVKETHVDHKESGVEVQEATKQTIPHAAERALWKAQREAGTNEVWQARFKAGRWCDVLTEEPGWAPDCAYRVKPMKLTAKIVRNIPMTFREYETRLHDWEFFGTREEYIAECEKYGYFVTGKIKEVGQVKPKTVKRYMAMLKDKVGQPFAFAHSSREEIEAHAKLWDITIIGDIEEREIEA